MANTALTMLSIILLTLAFEGLLFGDELVERSFPSFEEPQGGGFWGAIEAVIAVVQGIWGAVVFFFNLVTFNVPDAPFWVRLPVGGILGGGLVWSIATLVRGGGGS